MAPEDEVGRGRPQWQPTTGWHLKRVVGSVSTVFVVIWAGLIFTGNSHAITGLLNDGFPILPIVIVAIIVLGAGYGGAKSIRRRKEAQRVAAERGWDYRRSYPGIEGRWSDRPFGIGRRRSSRDVLLGESHGVRGLAFTYSYTTGSGKDSQTHHLSVASVAMPWSLPRLDVTPESLVGAIAPGLRGGDVDIENEMFNRYYRVRAEDRRYAVAILHPRAVEILLQLEPFAWRIDGSDLVAWSGVVDVATLCQRLDVLAEMVQTVPRFVVDDYAGR